jgi:hypothetical protein
MHFDTHTSRKHILDQQEKMLSKLTLKVGTGNGPSSTRPGMARV